MFARIDTLISSRSSVRSTSFYDTQSWVRDSDQQTDCVLQATRSTCASKCLEFYLTTRPDVLSSPGGIPYVDKVGQDGTVQQ